jgi:HK97 family phage portal protein
LRIPEAFSRPDLFGLWGLEVGILAKFREKFLESGSHKEDPRTGQIYRTGGSRFLATPQAALTLSAAYRAINALSTDVASLPLKVYRKNPDGTRSEETGHAVYDLLASSPDGETTSFRQRQAAMGHVLGWGNAYFEIERDRSERPLRIHLLPPNEVEPVRASRDLTISTPLGPVRIEAGRIYYRIERGRASLPPRDVIHLAGLGFDGLVGYSPVRLLRDSFELAKNAETWGKAFFANAARPSGGLKIPGRLDEIQREAAREAWADMHSGPDAVGRPAILTGGMDWVPFSVNPQDAQFLATRQFSAIEVAGIYRVPPNKIGEYSEAHYANVESANLDYLITVVGPWCESIEQSLNLKLFTPEERRAGFYVEHNLAAFLRADSKARAEFYAKLRDLGAISPNEIRAKENMDPVSGGNVYLVPLNMTTLENAGKNPSPSGAAANART